MSLVLVVSGLGSGILECPVDVTIAYTDGEASEQSCNASVCSAGLVHVFLLSSTITATV